MRPASRLFSRTIVLGSLPLSAALGCAANDGLPGAGSGGESATGGSVGTGASPGTGGAANGGSGTTGGAAGTGSTSGVGGTGTGGTPGAGVGCAGADLFCETFESVAVGAIPTGGAWLADGMSCQYQTGTFSKGVATDQPRGASTKAMKFTNKHQADCRMTANFGSSNDFWIRAYVYWDEAVSFDNVETIPVDLTPAGSQASDDPAIRFGSRTKEPCTGANGGAQITMIGWGSEYTGCDGSKPEIQGDWYCLEAHVRQAGGNAQVNSYVNGVAVTYAQNSVPAADTATKTGLVPPVDQIRIGPFSTGSMTGNLWVDDVAVATSRIGCSD